MDGLNEGDLLDIRRALEKESLIEALDAMERTLGKLGYRRVDRVAQYDIYLSSVIDTPELSARV